MRYVVYRLRRLPDPAHKISRGIAVGVFTSFTPLFGLHFILAAVLTWIIRGNVVAALLATFVGNPLTFPLIAAVAMELGSIILGERVLPLPLVLPSFSAAAADLWSNFIAIFTDEPTRWGGLQVFFDRVFLPYLVGGFIPGLIAAFAAYFFANPVIVAYQKARDIRRKKRFAKKRERIISRRISAEKAEVISKRAAAE